MKNLLKADFYRLLKNKLALIGMILAAALPLLIAGLFVLLREVGGYLDPDSKAGLDALINARLLIASSFSFSSNFGIVLPIFAAIIIMADLNSGMIRNKVTIGHKRHQIFASHYIVTLVFCVAAIVVYAAMTTLWGCLFLGTKPISSEHALTLVYFYILGVLGFALLSAIATSMSLVTMNNAASIMLTLGISLGFGLLAQLLSAFDYSSYQYVAYLLPNFVVTTYQSREITIVMFLEGLGGILLFTIAFYVFGVIGFNKRDLK